MKSPSPAAAGALSLILGVGAGIWASGLDLRGMWKSAGSADLVKVGVAAAPVTAPDSASVPALSDAGEAGEDADTGEGTGVSGPEGWEAGSLAEIPDLLQRMRRGHMPESARRDWLVAEMMRLVERDGYDGAEFSKGWERAGFEERSLMSSARLEALARLRSEQFTDVLRQGGAALLPEAETALGGMARAHLVAALELLASLKKQGVAVNGHGLFREWARRDGAAAVAAAKAGMAASAGADANHMAGGGAGSRNTDTVMGKKDSGKALNAALQGWMMGDPAGAVAELEKLRRAGAGMGKGKGTGTEMAFSSEGLPADWASEMTFQALHGSGGRSGDSAGALLQKVWNAVEGGDRGRLVANGFSALAAADAEKAVELWSGLPRDFLHKNGQARQPAGASMEGMAEGLAWASPQKAVEFMTPGPGKERLMGGDFHLYRGQFAAAGDMMAGNSPGQAAELANSLLTQNVGALTAERSLAVSVIHQAALNAETGADAGTHTGNSNSNSNSNSGVAGESGSGSDGGGSDGGGGGGEERAALALLAAIREPVIRGEAIPGIMLQLAFGNGGGIEAGDFLRLVGEPAARTAIANEYASNLLTVDFKKAVEWASENESAYPGTIRSLFDTWGSYDNPGRSEMLNAMTPEERQELIPNLAENLASVQPEAAVAWACSMAESPERTRTLLQVVENAKRSGAPLDALISHARLSPEDSALIRRTWSGGTPPAP